MSSADDEQVPTSGPSPGEVVVSSGEEQELEGAGGNNNSRFGCCSFNGNIEAKGVNLAGVARGAINMSNVYLANSLIHLACKAAGGFGPDDIRCVNPHLTIYGMKPAALITNIAVAASVMSALMMPLFGAIIDYTPHRKWVGIGTAALLAIISGVQIGTVEVSVVLCCAVNSFSFRTMS